MDPAFRIVIPARYASTRLPGKPLREIRGKPMIEWVYRAASRAGAEQVVVATDDERIVEAVEAFGGRACLTDSAHQSGTDRILEVTRKLAWDADTMVVNLQGDEPLMPAANIEQVAADLAASRDCAMATLYKHIDAGAAQDPNLVKLVHDSDGKALYFSRSPIPYDRGGGAQYLGHIGIYAYRAGFLETFSALPPGELERAEALEQLRALANGYAIHCAPARENPGPGIDTEEDLEQAENLLASAPA
ncbi:MAG: 3-deoxy-manno-octulosonate cytidylyltransferase [Gammaproteobacteria bacterium]|jgi:3-deoxy-manno-octulosonate cytidylyltransferase (CMP-KDO synthetase)